jgi:hypothetical protein
MLGLSGQRVHGALAGAWETFFSQQNADAWYVYDWGLDDFFFVEWQDTPVNAEFIYSFYTGDGELSFVADEFVGNGDFVGDYASQKIAGVSCEVYIGSLADLDMIDCALYANGPAGRRYYYSESYLREDFADSGWWWLDFSFDDSWFYWDGANWVEVSAYALSDIETLEITFVPRVGTTSESIVGLDDVTLEPTVLAPKVETGVKPGSPRQFELAFTPPPGLECRVEKMKKPPATGWETVTGQTGIKGPAEHRFTTPAVAGSELFRVAAEPYYTIVVSQ